MFLAQFCLYCCRTPKPTLFLHYLYAVWILALLPFRAVSFFFSFLPPPSISFLYLSWNSWGQKSARSASFVHCVSFPHVPLLPEKLNFRPLKIHLLCLDFTELKNRTFHQTVQFKIKLNCTSAQEMWQDKDPSHLKNLFKDLPNCTCWYFHMSLKVNNWSVMWGLSMGHLRGPFWFFFFFFFL